LVFWSRTFNKKKIEERTKGALQSIEEKKKHKAEFEKKIEETKTSLKQHAENEMIDVPQEFDSPEYADSKMKILGFGKKRW